MNPLQTTGCCETLLGNNTYNHLLMMTRSIRYTIRQRLSNQIRVVLCLKTLRSGVKHIMRVSFSHLSSFFMYIYICIVLLFTVTLDSLFVVETLRFTFRPTTSLSNRLQYTTAVTLLFRTHHYKYWCKIHFYCRKMSTTKSNILFIQLPVLFSVNLISPNWILFVQACEVWNTLDHF